MLKTDISAGKFEFEFTDADFDNLRAIVTKETGIQLPPSKKALMYSRLSRRLRELKIDNFKAYCTYIKQKISSGDEHELMEMVNAMTTNVTHFFREPHHFDTLAEKLGELSQKFNDITIWCAASSTGEEPWSIAMVVADFLKQNPRISVNIIASDIDKNVLRKAAQGEYLLEEAEAQKNPYMKKYMSKQKDALNSNASPFSKTPQYIYHVDADLKKLVTFKHINLLKDWPLPTKRIHVVFCRNVIIYFDKETQRGIFSRLSPIMPSGSLLFIGHSESLLGVSDQFKHAGRTTYEKV